MQTIKTPYYQVEAFEKILVIRSFQAWDDRVAKKFSDQVREIVTRLYAVGNWAILHDATQWELGTPEAKKVLAGLVGTKITGGLTHHALVIGNSKIKAWLTERIFEDVGHYQIGFFKDIPDAESWLLNSGYQKT